MQRQKILILDFGSQVTQLIARKVREMHEAQPCWFFEIPFPIIERSEYPKQRAVQMNHSSHATRHH